jgi:hypothetical protein
MNNKLTAPLVEDINGNLEDRVNFGKEVNGYIIRTILGKGTFGVVYVGYD